MEPRPEAQVAEAQGLYGPFTFSERLFQKIWDQGAFDQRQLQTLDGQPVRLERRGKWNHLAGPDFKHARVQVGAAPPVDCDVELHLYASDWEAHGHASDPAYDRVKLHVVLFPPPSGYRTLGRGVRSESGGRGEGGGGPEIATVCLLPLLYHDLEQYAADEAVESLAGRKHDPLAESIRRLSPEELRARLAELATQRWQRKLHYAHQRVRRLGFAEACHQTALEILGFRFNRVPMLNLAQRYPLQTWAGLGAAEIEARLAEEDTAWARGAVRPANQPRQRLNQYARWVSAVPDWPERLAALPSLPLLALLAPHFPGTSMSADTREVRRLLGLAALREKLAAQICAGVIGGTRLDTLICDGLLPLMALRTDRELAGIWWHWWPGDLPGFLQSARRDLSAVLTPSCQGAIQGLIGWALELDAKPSGAPGKRL